MEFLHKLYDMEYFGIVLFAVIVILIVLFLIILFFGKKDEKKKLEETQKLNLENNAFKEEDTKQALEISEVPQPVIENTESVVSENLDNIFATDVAGVQAESENIVKEVEEPKFEDIAPVIENTPVENNIFEEEPTVDDLFNEEEKVDEITFVENSNTQTPVVEDIQKEEKPTFELPKMAEMPKLKEEEKAEDITPVVEDISKENIEETKKEETVSDFDKLFGELETETYDIDK